MATGMEAMYVPQIVSTRSPHLSYTPLLLNFQPASNRDQMLGFQYGTIPVGNLPDTWWHFGPIPYIGPIPSWK